jgi:cyclopropane-fatty-acyl-phospholipid synthase
VLPITQRISAPSTACSSPAGSILHHSIALRSAAYERLHKEKGRRRRSRSVRYIFPGGELDHLGMSIANLERYGFEVHDVEAWREHYARTTRLWHDRLCANRAAAEREVGAVKTRLWIAYLAACSIGFAQTASASFRRSRRSACAAHPAAAVARGSP